MNTTIGRFAPTPSGRMHLGNIYTAMLAYLYAKSSGGKFILRVEDLDYARCKVQDVENMLDDLRFFGFDFEGEIIYQSKRGDIYSQYFDVLKSKSLLYPCYCSRGRVAATAPHAGENVVYDGKCRELDAHDTPDKSPCFRIIVPDTTIRFIDGVRGEYAQNMKTECGDFIVRRADGVAAYQLAVVCDDALSGVTQVVRGSDLISSTPRQIYLYNTLGFTPPAYFHTPLLLGEHGERLSKRDNKDGLKSIRAVCPHAEPILGVLAFNAGIIDRYRPCSLKELAACFDPQRLKKENTVLNTCGEF